MPAPPMNKGKTKAIQTTPRKGVEDQSLPDKKAQRYQDDQEVDGKCANMLTFIVKCL